MSILRTGPRDLAPDCLLVGRPRLARMIAEKLLKKAVRVGDNDEHPSFTGAFHGQRISVIACGSSTEEILPEAKASGGCVFIRVATRAHLGRLVIPIGSDDRLFRALIASCHRRRYLCQLGDLSSRGDEALFVWCATNGGHPAAAVHAAHAGVARAARVALDALHRFRIVGI